MTEWNIQGRAHACEACGRHFKDKEAYHTLLFDERTGFRRSDICESCWQQQYSQGARDRKGFVSYWQGVFEAPPPPTEAIQKQTAESLLRELIKLAAHSCRAGTRLAANAGAHKTERRLETGIFERLNWQSPAV